MDAAIADPGQDAVQLRLVGDRPGQDGGAVRMPDQSGVLEPSGPVNVEVSSRRLSYVVDRAAVRRVVGLVMKVLLRARCGGPSPPSPAERRVGKTIRVPDTQSEVQVRIAQDQPERVSVCTALEGDVVAELVRQPQSHAGRVGVR